MSEAKLDKVAEALDEVREIIDGEMNCHTAEYRAVNALYLIVSDIHAELVEQAAARSK